MKKSILLFVIIFNTFNVWTQDYHHSDIIDGPANIREKANGKLLFELNDNSAVTSTVLKNNWHKIGLFIKVNDIESKNYLYAGDLIYNMNNEVIGKVKNKTPINLKRGKSNTGFIFGYTFKNNIKKTKSPEYILNKLLEKNKSKTKEEFNYFLNKYHFELYGNHEYLLPEIDMYTISESILYDITPTFRMSLLFKENRIIGVAHTRPIEVEGYKSIELYDSQKFTDLSNCEDEQFISALKNSLIQFFKKAD